jgi:hypothetical protein
MDAYEIRLEILRLARDIVSAEVDIKNRNEDNEFQIANDLWREEKYKKTNSPLLPNYMVVTTEKVLTEAQLLNNFISNSKQPKTVITGLGSLAPIEEQ